MGKKVGLIGAGAWGTAFTTALARNGHDVEIWAREELYNVLNKKRISKHL